MSNLYEDHLLMIDSGTFYRCLHGYTGFDAQCWHCGLFHPIRFVRWWWSSHA